VLTALGQVLQDHMGYVKGVHYLRLDGGVSDTRMGGGGRARQGGRVRIYGLSRVYTTH
jgi:hypothetical protein